MKKISKKNMALFLKSIEKILIDANFRATDNTDYFKSRYNWVKETKDFGKVYFKPDNDNDTEIYSIFGMFENIEKCKNININLIDIFDINPYSGKCNFHNKNIDAVIYMFSRLLHYINNDI
jgi:hypothetical protein